MSKFRLRIGRRGLAIIVAVIITVIALDLGMALYMVSNNAYQEAINILNNAHAAAAISQYTVILNITPPPYNETHSIPKDLINLVNNTLSAHGIKNYKPITTLEHGNYYYVLITINNGGDYLGILIHNNEAEIDPLTKVPISENSTVETIPMGNNTKLVLIEKYELYELTGPLLSKYFPDASFFGGYVNYTGILYIGPATAGAVVDYGEYVGETGQWIELTYVHDYTRTYVFWVSNCVFTNNYSPLYTPVIEVYDTAAGSFISLLSCPGLVEDWFTIYVSWTVNNVGNVTLMPIILNKGLAYCGFCPAAP
ncbi:hypothetical protein [Vulcanisaeta thermophila]|uniref:hypothetical protein n=1 Tax=Vulcanisaeta thermophila TaxID=867917 RepID=UPI000853086D|nr:hypothetical protein [Vulcanisaeta thermophila]